MKHQKLDPMSFGLAAAITAAVAMLFLGILPGFGLYSGAANAMMGWHMYFTLSPLGVAFGMIEAAIISFLFGWLFAWIYNKTSK